MNTINFIQYDQIVLKAIATLAGGLIAYFAIRAFIDFSILNLKKKHRLASYKQRLDTLRTLLHNLLFFVFSILIILMLLKDFGFDITPLLTGAGIAGLAFSFGAQTLIRDLISGFFIIIENIYNVGDDIEIDKFKGRIQKINLRTTVLKDEKSNLIYIPNSEIKKVKVFKKEKI